MADISPSSPPAGQNSLYRGRLVYAVVQAPHQSCHRDLQHLADTQKRCDRNRASSFNLLPVSSGKTERNHVLLRIASLLAKLAHFSTQSTEESFLICHALLCNATRAS